MTNDNNPPRATLADRESREFGIEPLDATTAPKFAALGVDQRRKLIADALFKHATVPAKRCKACGGGAAYLEKRPELDYCTPECEAYGAKKIQAVRISSALDIDLSGVPMQLRGEDAAASEMFDGPEPPTEEPSISIGELIEERDEAIAALDRAIDELRVARAENDALRKHLNAALDRARDLEASK